MYSKKRGTVFVYKKKSTIGKIPVDPLQNICLDYDLSMTEVQHIQKCFKRYDPTDINAIQWYEVDDVYRDMEIEISESIRNLIVEQLKQYDSSSADFTLVCKIYAEIKKLKEKEDEEFEQMETINAFVAMGGNYDRTGEIPKNTIIQIIKDDFQLDFDIEAYLEKQGLAQNELLSYQDFYKIFEANEEGKELLSTYSQGMFKRKQKNVEAIPGITPKKNKKTQEDEEEKDFQVSYKDFEQWLTTQDSLDSAEKQEI